MQIIKCQLVESKQRAFIHQAFIYWREAISFVLQNFSVWTLVIASLLNHLTCCFDPHIFVMSISPVDLTTEFRFKLVVLQEYLIGGGMFFHQETHNVCSPVSLPCGQQQLLVLKAQISLFWNRSQLSCFPFETIIYL